MKLVNQLLLQIMNPCITAWILFKDMKFILKFSSA